MKSLIVLTIATLINTAVTSPVGGLVLRGAGNCACIDDEAQVDQMWDFIENDHAVALDALLDDIRYERYERLYDDADEVNDAYQRIMYFIGPEPCVSPKSVHAVNVLISKLLAAFGPLPNNLEPPLRDEVSYAVDTVAVEVEKLSQWVNEIWDYYPDCAQCLEFNRNTCVQPNYDIRDFNCYMEYYGLESRGRVESLCPPAEGECGVRPQPCPAPASSLVPVSSSAVPESTSGAVSSFVPPVSSSAAPTTSSLTPEPSSVDPKPSHSTPEPSSAAPVPSSAAPVPSSAAPVPSSAAPEPSSADPEPSSVSPEPSHSTPEPSSVDPEPSHLTPEPSSTAPVPSSETSEPSSAAPVPSSEISEPSSEAPEPSSAAPQSSFETPELSSATPEPSFEAPEPSSIVSPMSSVDSVMSTVEPTLSSTRSDSLLESLRATSGASYNSASSARQLSSDRVSSTKKAQTSTGSVATKTKLSPTTASEGDNVVHPVVTVVTEFTTYCPEPTTYCPGNGHCYTVEKPTTLTISDCPRTFTAETGSENTHKTVGVPSSQSASVSMAPDQVPPVVPANNGCRLNPFWAGAMAFIAVLL